MLTLQELACVLGAREEHLRVMGLSTIVGVAGSFGIARYSNSGDLIHVVIKHPERMDEDMRQFATRRGIIAKLAPGCFELRRMPAGADEKAAIAGLLGIYRGKVAV